jgi:putative membrane protein
MMGNEFGFGFHGLGMFLFWGLVIFLVVMLVRAFTGGDREENKALEILRQRLASGEIDKDEYEEKKKLLI